MSRSKFVLTAAALLLSLVSFTQPGLSQAGTALTVEKRFVIILIGPTGSGKTTQTEILKKNFGLPAISVDDLIRDNPSLLTRPNSASTKTTGTKTSAKGVTTPPQANPAMDPLVDAALRKLDLTKGVVLDGYPASKEQADHLAELVRTNALPPPIVIQLDVPDDVVLERLKKRERADDTPELIAQRLKQYHRELDMVRAYYPKANIWTIDGTRSINDVAATIRSILNDELPKHPPGDAPPQ
ncbi:MAG: nucleoside monophosphate kinase [Bryobacteraceae bacterium]